MSEVGRRHRSRPVSSGSDHSAVDDPRGSPRLHDGHKTISVASEERGYQRRARRTPLAIICASPALTFVFLSAILSNAGLSVVVPSLAIQLEIMEASPELLGYVAAAAPLVSVISPTLMGWLANRWAAAGAKNPYSRVYFVTMSLFALGNGLQCFAKTPVSLGVSRVLIGCSTGSVSVGLGYIMRELKHPDERTAVVNIFSGVEMMGYISGTALGGILSTVKGRFFGLQINGFTAPTLVSASAALLLMLFGLSGFSARERQLLTAKKKTKNTSHSQRTGTNAPESMSGCGDEDVGLQRRMQQQQRSSETRHKFSDDSGDDDPPPPPPLPRATLSRENSYSQHGTALLALSSSSSSSSASSSSSSDGATEKHQRQHPRSFHASSARSSTVAGGKDGSSGGGVSRGSFGGDLRNDVKGGGGIEGVGQRGQQGYFVLGLITALYCMVAAMYNALETTSTPLTSRFFGWGVRENALLWTCSGVVGTAVSLGVGHLPSNLLHPRDLLAAALAAATVGPWLMLLSLNRAQLDFSQTGTMAVAAATRAAVATTTTTAAAAAVAQRALEAVLGAGEGSGGDSGGVLDVSFTSSSALAKEAEGAGEGGEEEDIEENGNRHQRTLLLFWVGFVLFDIGYVIIESMLTILFAAAIEARANNKTATASDLLSAQPSPRGTLPAQVACPKSKEEDPAGFSSDFEEEEEKVVSTLVAGSEGEDKEGAVKVEGEQEGEGEEVDAREALYFGVFTSVGWFLGCALGAVAGNHLFLISAQTLLRGCSTTALAVAVALFAAHHHVFAASDDGSYLSRCTLLHHRRGSSTECVPRLPCFQRKGAALFLAGQHPAYSPAYSPASSASVTSAMPPSLIIP